MTIGLLFPHFDHHAIEERYAAWQSEMLLRAGGDVEFHRYDPEEPASYAADAVDSEHVLVVTDPLLVPPQNFAARLREVLLSSGSAVAALPVTNRSDHAGQVYAPGEIYFTLRELQALTARMQSGSAEVLRLKWDRSDPGAYLCATSMLQTCTDAPRHALTGCDVVISRNDYVHRWSSLRGQVRTDLLDLIATDAKSILEFGCGEAPLGEALKKRQPCRVVGIELDPDAAAIAQKRIDAVYRGDVRELVDIIDERFDWIVGGDIVEHIDEPWSFLCALRRVAKPGGRLLLSTPNISNGSLVADLLHGRFDYVYMGLTCVGHVRFFTRQTIEDMLTISGWSVERITPQFLGSTPSQNDLFAALDRGGYRYDKDDLAPTGYYIIARNDS